MIVKGVIRMMQIRPVSDLRNKYPEVEQIVVGQQQPVFLTKNGYGSMVVLSMEQYAALVEPVAAQLDEADAAERDPARLSSDEVFESARARIRGKKSV